jgi:hypothetical protein
VTKYAVRLTDHLDLCGQKTSTSAGEVSFDATGYAEVDKDQRAFFLRLGWIEDATPVAPDVLSAVDTEAVIAQVKAVKEELAAWQQKIEQAKEEAARIIADAEAEAAKIVKAARAEVEDEADGETEMPGFPPASLDNPPTIGTPFTETEVPQSRIDPAALEAGIVTRSTSGRGRGRSRG